MVLSGHFHHKSSDGQITYVGTPGEITWSDYNDKRGFHILDTESGELEFIENPYRMFHKVFYNDNREYNDLKKYKDKIVKVIVETRTNEYLYNKFFDELYEVSPVDVSIVEGFIDYTEVSESDTIDQAQDTVTILDNYIDALEINLDSDKLKGLMREIYNEAQKNATI
jgi:hypothetical protein